MAVTVRSGDTLSRIARDNGTTVAELVALNPEISNPNLIFPGQSIVLPGDAATEQIADQTDGPDGGEGSEGGDTGDGGLGRDVLAELYERFPLAATLIDIDPELRAIVEQAVEEEWAADLISQRLQDSEWWTTRTEEQRQFDIEAETDPAEIQDRVDRQTLALSNQLTRLGIVMDDDALAELARNTVRSGYDENQINAVIFGEDRDTTGAGTIDVMIDALGDIARSYLVDVAPDVLERRAFDVAAGTDTPEAFKLWAENQAISAYGHNQGLVEALDRGLTVEDFADPYRQLAARELELPESAVSLSDPKFRDSILAGNLSLGDWRQQLRSNPLFGWNETVAAQDQAWQLGTELRRGLGLVTN